MNFSAFSVFVIALLTVFQTITAAKLDTRATFRGLPQGEADSWHPGQRVSFEYLWNGGSNRLPAKSKFVLKAAHFKTQTLEDVVVTGPDADHWFTATGTIPTKTSVGSEWSISIKGVFIGGTKARSPMFRIDPAVPIEATSLASSSTAPAEEPTSVPPPPPTVSTTSTAGSSDGITTSTVTVSETKAAKSPTKSTSSTTTTTTSSPAAPTEAPDVVSVSILSQALPTSVSVIVPSK